MNFNPELPASAGPLADLERRLLGLIAGVRLERGVGYKVRPGPRGTVLEIEGAGAATPPGSFVNALILTEGPDALVCSTDGGDTSFVVMKPEPLRVNRALAFGGGTLFYMGQFPTFTLQTDQAVWDDLGFVLNAAWPDSPDPREGLMTVWPQWIGGESGASTALNGLRTVGSSEPRQTLLCARLPGVATVTGATLVENLLGLGDTRVDYVDLTPGRAWRFVDEITQQLGVTDAGGVIGGVNPI